MVPPREGDGNIRGFQEWDREYSREVADDEEMMDVRKNSERGWTNGPAVNVENIRTFGGEYADGKGAPELSASHL